MVRMESGRRCKNVARDCTLLAWTLVFGECPLGSSCVAVPTLAVVLAVKPPDRGGFHWWPPCRSYPDARRVCGAVVTSSDLSRTVLSTCRSLSTPHLRGAHLAEAS